MQRKYSISKIVSIKIFGKKIKQYYIYRLLIQGKPQNLLTLESVVKLIFITIETWIEKSFLKLRKEVIIADLLFP